jgi:hypothetical protein
MAIRIATENSTEVSAYRFSTHDCRKYRQDYGANFSMFLCMFHYAHRWKQEAYNEGTLYI